MKLIDADLLKEELENELIKIAEERKNNGTGTQSIFIALQDIYMRLVCKITSLSEYIPSDNFSEELIKLWNEYSFFDFDRLLPIVKLTNEEFKEVAIHFANWQKEKTINSACEYLQQHREEVKTEDNGIAGWIDNEFIDNFRKAMELS